MSLLARVQACQRWQPEAYRPWIIDGQGMGYLRHELAERLKDFTNVFLVDDKAVRLAPGLADFESRTAAVDEVVQQLVAAGEIERWRGEFYAVTRRWGDPPLMILDRGAVPDFGVRGFGVHMNGYVERADGLHLWVGKRAMNKATAPGALDHLVAGGQPHGIGIRENLIKECAEEADIPRALAEQAEPAGAVCYRCERPEGLRDDVAFCYDLALPEDFEPNNTDGEVDSFSLWPIEEVVARMAATTDFKFNVNLVNIHFLVRRGLLTPDAPDYQAILEHFWLDEAPG
ncbi:MAG: DUF4743 domain-containing protein [Pseudomonadota bacterium]